MPVAAPKVEELFESIRERKTLDAFGIGVASAYVGAMGSCLDGAGLCPANIFKLAAGNRWQKELEDSVSRLVYSDESTVVFEKSIREGTDISAGAVLEYDCVLSSKRQDRDRDIVEQKGGLELDPRSPGLWQHIQLSPVGKMVRLIEQTELFTKCRFAIADTELGRDAATLVKFGALRKSIGFKANEFSPLEIVKNAEGRDVVRGWHIKKSLGLEGSLVSIPANADANVLAVYAKEFDGLATAFSRDSLKEPLVKHWAKGIYDLRPVQVAGADIPAAAPATEKADAPKTECGCGGGSAKAGGKCSKCGGEMSCAACSGKKSTGIVEPDDGADLTTPHKCPKCKVTLDTANKCPKCGWEKKSLPAYELIQKAGAPLSAVKMAGSYPYPAGSFEAVQAALRSTARSYLTQKGVPFSSDSYVEVFATMADAALVSVEPYGGPNRSRKLYQVGYTTKDGMAAFDGDPSEVMLDVQIVSKALESPAVSDPSRFADSLKSATPQALARQLVAKSISDDSAVQAIREMQPILKAFDVDRGALALAEMLS